MSDWSSDVCSSDLPVGCWSGQRCGQVPSARCAHRLYLLRHWGGVWPACLHRHRLRFPCHSDRKSVGSGKSVSVRVDLGGRRKITIQNIQVYLILFITYCYISVNVRLTSHII